MTVELGHFALLLALAVACVQGTLPLAGAATGNAAWMRVALLETERGAAWVRSLRDAHG